jgi:hypothetical protein
MLSTSVKKNSMKMSGSFFRDEGRDFEGTSQADLKLTEGAGINNPLNWMEVRPVGKNPERRGYHSAFVHHNKLYIYGGRDLSKGTIANMWVADMQPMHRLFTEGGDPSSDLTGI